MARYAKVIVDISLEKLDRTFTYRIPGALRDALQPGMEVKVPFGNANRQIAGYVLELTDTAEYDEGRLKEILAISPKGMQIEGQLIRLAAWMRRAYGCTMIQALKTVLPVKRQMQEKQRRQVYLVPSRDEAERILTELERKSQPARLRVMAALLDKPVWEYGELLKTCHVAPDVLRKMEELAYLSVESQVVFRKSLPGEEAVAAGETPGVFRLNRAQRQVADGILQGLEAGDLRPCLLRGVTGSGKTEVYMELIGEVLRKGRQAIVLIPEIALTYQTVRRFYRRFGHKVAVLHSRLSQGERHDQFELARKGKIQVMIGPRSALFAPFSNLGMIVIDEEHENSYKSEITPRYHARETAIYRAELSGALVVMGSATPSVDAYYRALRGEYRLFTMEERVEERPLPKATVVDLRKELMEGNRSVFSGILREKLNDRLKKREQTLLFLNRRGLAGFVTCRSCGHVVKCSHCDVSLTLHKNGRMICHYCGHEEPAAKRCPACGSAYMGALRAGTQQIEEALYREFPGIRVLRMDADTTRTRDAYEEILGKFSAGEADVLLGTQMIVKGHDFPGVTLVGALAADLSLHASDYRAAERTFQLLAQAAGRAGRGEKPGEVVIQTYSPEHYSIETAAGQDYPAFYQREILYRKLMGYPPAWGLLAVYISGPQEEPLDMGAAAVRAALDRLNKEEELQIIGPAVGAVSRVQDQYRRVIYIKGEQEERLIALREALEPFLEAECFASLHIQFDRNPMNGY